MLVDKSNQMINPRKFLIQKVEFQIKYQKKIAYFFKTYLYILFSVLTNYVPRYLV